MTTTDDRPHPMDVDPPIEHLREVLRELLHNLYFMHVQHTRPYEDQEPLRISHCCKHIRVDLFRAPFDKAHEVPAYLHSNVIFTKVCERCVRGLRDESRRCCALCNRPNEIPPNRRLDRYRNVQTWEISNSDASPLRLWVPVCRKCKDSLDSAGVQVLKEIPKYKVEQ